MTKLQESGSSASDFLSSLEIVIIDHADVIMMQNWQHVQTLFQNCNKLPKESHGTDVMRVHESHLNGLAKNLRQTVVLSSFPAAEINALTRNECRNVAGRVRWKETFSGVLGWAARAVQNAGGLRQQFERLPDSSMAVRLFVFLFFMGEGGPGWLEREFCSFCHPRGKCAQKYKQWYLHAMHDNLYTRGKNGGKRKVEVEESEKHKSR